MNLTFPITSWHTDILASRGAIAVSVLTETDIANLLEKTSQYQFKWRERVTETKVEQNFLGFDEFKQDDIFLELASETENRLQEIFAHMVSLPIKFNDYSLQLYPVSKSGEKHAISPHKDHKNCINLIAVYVLKGMAPFCLCDDRSGNNRIEIEADPGDLILMRGTGFGSSDVRPFHYVGKVSEERLTFGMRQTVDKKNLPRIQQSTDSQKI